MNNLEFMAVNGEPEASLKSSVDEPDKISFAGLECDVVDAGDDCSIGNSPTRKASDVALAVEDDAGPVEPYIWVDSCKSAIVTLLHSQKI